jgi:hypothetical protein
MAKVANEVWDDLVTPVDEANQNKMLAGDTDGIYACFGYHIYYDGAAWQVSTTEGATESAGDVVVTWVGAGNYLEVDTSGINNPFSGGVPIAVVSASMDNDANYEVKAAGWTTNAARVSFYNIDTGAVITTEASTMDFNILLFGRIA